MTEGGYVCLTLLCHHYLISLLFVPISCYIFHIHITDVNQWSYKQYLHNFQNKIFTNPCYLCLCTLLLTFITLIVVVFS